MKYLTAGGLYLSLPTTFQLPEESLFSAHHGSGRSNERPALYGLMEEGIAR